MEQKEIEKKLLAIEKQIRDNLTRQYSRNMPEYEARGKALLATGNLDYNILTAIQQLLTEAYNEGVTDAADIWDKSMPEHKEILSLLKQK